jgi:hypothetical protein
LPPITTPEETEDYDKKIGGGKYQETKLFQLKEEYWNITAPRMIMHHENLDFKKNCKVPSSPNAQAHNEPLTAFI